MTVGFIGLLAAVLGQRVASDPPRGRGNDQRPVLALEAHPQTLDGRGACYFVLRMLMLRQP
jgi:hypothetical protein